MRGLKSAAFAAVVGALALSPVAQAELLAFSYTGAVTNTADSNPGDGTPPITFTFNNPNDVLTFQGLNDGSLTLTSVDYAFATALNSNLNVNTTFGGVIDDLRATNTFSVTGGSSVTTGAADATSNSFLIFSATAGANSFAPTSVSNSMITGSLTDAATLAAFTNNATVDVDVSSVFSNTFFPLGASTFTSFTPFAITGTLELTLNTVAAPIPGSVALLAAGLGLLSFRFKRKAA